MNTDPNMVWGGSQVEAARLQNKMARARAKIDATKRMIEAERKKGYTRSDGRLRGLEQQLVDALAKYARLEQTYDAGLRVWGT